MEVITTEMREEILTSYRNVLSGMGDDALWAQYLQDRKRAANTADIVFIHGLLVDVKAYIDRRIDGAKGKATRLRVTKHDSDGRILEIVKETVEAKAEVEAVERPRVRVPAGKSTMSAAEYAQLVKLAQENRQKLIEGGMVTKDMAFSEPERQRLVEKDQLMVEAMMAKPRHRVQARSAPCMTR